MAGVKGMRQGKVYQSDRHKVVIDSKRIANRLQDHIFGDAKLEASQVTAALGLLKKKLPDLAATTISGDEDNPVKHVIEVRHFIVRQEDGDTPGPDGSGI